MRQVTRLASQRDGMTAFTSQLENTRLLGIHTRVSLQLELQSVISAGVLWLEWNPTFILLLGSWQRLRYAADEMRSS